MAKEATKRSNVGKTNVLGGVLMMHLGRQSKKEAVHSGLLQQAYIKRILGGTNNAT